MTNNNSRPALLAFFLALVIGNFSFAFSQSEWLIPANTKIAVQLLSPISTATARKNDKFSCKVLTPVEFAGAIVEGHIRSVKRSGKANKESKLDLAFDRIALPDGRLADFRATVVEVFDVAKVGDQGRADNEGVVRNKSVTLKTSIKRAAMGALIGAAVGGIVAGGQGAAVGAAIGAGLGVTTTLATKGPDLEFNTGTQFTVETNGPVRSRALKPGESQVAGPSQASGTSANNLTSPQPPPLPSASLLMVSLTEFNLGVPENWREMSKNPFIFGPDGSYKINNSGQSEFTHGLMVGTVDIGSRELKQATERFMQALSKTNSHLYAQVGSAPISLGSTDAIATTLSGKGRDGYMESVVVHTAMLASGKLFFLITVVPTEQAAGYVDAFRAIAQSVELK